MLYYGKHHKWPEHVSRSEANYTDDLLRRLFHDSMGQADRLQIPKDSLAATQEVPKGGPL
jgi:hypothetical protein